MGYKLILTLETENDIDKAVEWYINIEKRTAVRFIKELKDVKNYIHKNPKKLAIKYNNVRVAFLKKFPYALHYTLSKNTIIILALFHTAENPDKWDKR